MPETLFIGHKALWLNETSSTNDYLLNWLEKEYLPEGTTVAAYFQSSGKGQRGTSWQSLAGQNLMVSILLKPTFITIKNQFILSKAIALAVHELLLQFVPLADVKIKWPNDIYVNEGKISGILIENVIQNQYIKTSIAGIGININQVTFAVENATSLKLETGQDFSLKNVLNQLCVFLEKRYLQLLRADYEQINKDYISKLYGLNENRKFKIEADGSVINGQITGLSADGKLHVLIGNEPKFFGLKEITFL